MSYVLHFWASPIPGSVAEAGQIRARLGDETSRQNPMFIDLAAKLTARHPCITKLPEESPLAVWSDGPLDGRCDKPVYSIGLLYTQVGTVLQFVIETATSLGLTTYDMQSGQVHLATGAILAKPGQKPIEPRRLAAAWAEELTSEGVTEAALNAIEAAAHDQGFEFRPDYQCFVRKQQGFDQHLSVAVENDYPNWKFRLWVNLYVAAGAELGADCSSSEYILRWEYEWTEPGYDVWFVVGTTPELEAAVAQLALFVRLTVIPVLNDCVSMADIDRLLNNPANATWKANDKEQAPLVIAHLAGNPHFDKIAAQTMRDIHPYYRPNMEKLLARLQELRATGTQQRG